MLSGPLSVEIALKGISNRTEFSLYGKWTVFQCFFLKGVRRRACDNNMWIVARLKICFILTLKVCSEYLDYCNCISMCVRSLLVYLEWNTDWICRLVKIHKCRVKLWGRHGKLNFHFSYGWYVRQTRLEW